ncbi:MAG: glucose-6-phosphate dehydrogenase [Nitrospirota bacterium]|nr:glucose-6-phosphate dehydrogenase [Nitrospirota bacterium]
MFQNISSTVRGQIIQRPAESCEIDKPGPFCLVIFGASGDLTKRKLIPSIYRLYSLKLIEGEFIVLGVARSDMNDETFRESMLETVKKANPDDFSDSSWREFAKRLFYSKVEYSELNSYNSLKENIFALENEHQLTNRVFYIATPPTVYETIIENLGDAGLSQKCNGSTHIVIEKPFGRDPESAKGLNHILRKSFAEKQIYRMDHYLAKENVQNILMFRFANSIFEPLWNRNFIDYVQISVSETLGVEHRAGYYEKSGVLRDMFQNHLLQLVALTAMEPPSVFEADRVRDEKVKVFRSIKPFPLDRLDDYAVLGQYGDGEINGVKVTGYRNEPGVAPDSVTPTFAALKVFIDNWRWSGVPFYLRSGKRLSTQKAEISIHFKHAPHMMFDKTMKAGIEPNVLVLRVQPDEGIGLVIQTKNPGSRIYLNSVLMDFSYEKALMLGPYERALLDCMQSDQMLFVRADGVELTWELLMPVIERLESETRPDKFPNYAAGSTGPAESAALLEREDHSWKTL